MKSMLMAGAVAIAVTASAAAAANTVEGSRDIARYQKAAGSEVTQMPLPALVDWQALDDQSLAVWTAHDKPWLVRVEAPCAGLKDSDDVMLTVHGGHVMAGSDYVEVGSGYCKIASIQPVDYAQVAHLNRMSKHKHRQAAKQASG